MRKLMLTIKDIYQLIHDECGIKPEKLFPDSDLNGILGSREMTLMS